MNVFIEDTKSWHTMIHAPRYHDQSTPSAEAFIRSMGAMYPNGEFRERDQAGDFDCSDVDTFNRYAFDLECYDEFNYLIDKIKSETDYPHSYVDDVIANAEEVINQSTSEALSFGLLCKNISVIIAHEFGYLDELDK